MHFKVSTKATRALAMACLALLVLATTPCRAASLQDDFQDPPAEASPWVFWYWMNAAVSREGITADLEAMADAGLGGAYLMPIQGPTDPPLVEPPVNQLTPEWWECVGHALAEAKRLGLEIGMHACDGFAVAGGPWITPELSMQRLVWSETRIADAAEPIVLPQPAAWEGYYQDVAVLAFPAPAGDGLSTDTVPVTVTTTAVGETAQQLVESDNERRLRSAEPCSIDFTFDEPFTCRSVTVWPDGRNYQCQRFTVEAITSESNGDGERFRPIARLDAPRHGWQEQEAPVTHAIPPTTARRFRLTWTPEGSEPGAEDLDTAKWSPVLKVKRIRLASETRLHHYRGKTGAVWRVSPWSTPEQIGPSACTPRAEVIDLSDKLSADGALDWAPPPGAWTVLRLGHTSTGAHNETGGAGLGLECDKFNPDAVRLQFDRWFGEALRRYGDIGSLGVLHVDSWECGSQNWSADFREEFTERRGYDPLLYLPAMAGYPIASAEKSERFLHDVRMTIAELVDEVFYGVMAEKADEHGVRFTGECTAPTFTGAGMRHFARLDAPMGEFWIDSPTHDKPNDMRDAVSAAHVYGKNIVQAEAFTRLRMAWDETPAKIKALGDRHYVLGANRFVFHVWAHNPWLDRAPGMTLGGVGLFFQRDQAWWPMAGAWVDYARRCQALLQRGRPVADVAVFAGEEVPNRAVLPERLVASLPGLLGERAVERERVRLLNEGQPTHEMPTGVKNSANGADLSDWPDPLRGYQYDSLGRDALLRLARCEEGRVVLPGGASYALLVVPAPRPMAPAPGRMSLAVAEKLRELSEAGAKVLVVEPPQQTWALGEEDASLRGVTRDAPWLTGPWDEPSLASIGVAEDLVCYEASGVRSEGLAWAHRHAEEGDLYFVSNQLNAERLLRLSLRAASTAAEVWDPVSGDRRPVAAERTPDGRTAVELRLPPLGSCFVVLTSAAAEPAGGESVLGYEAIDGPWSVGFASAAGPSPEAIELATLQDLSTHPREEVRHFAGVATYETSFTAPPDALAGRAWIDLGAAVAMAEVSVNGRPAAVAWTPPYRVEVTGLLKAGENRLSVAVGTTWRNRLVGDAAREESERSTWTTAPLRLEGKPLTPSGLFGPVTLEHETPSAGAR
ncbi:glycosyl hydrolase [Pseudobythopirellula maris]|nr:glycosyl hydrolase [Pseudobythopirellula maris]